MTRAANVVGLGTATVQSLQGVPSLGLTARVMPQADATPIQSTISEFTTVPSGGACLLPKPTRGDTLTVVNRGANTLLIYPPIGSSLDYGTVNAAYSLQPDDVIQFVAQDDLNYFTNTNYSSIKASQIPIVDAGNYYTDNTVEGALQEVGKAKPVDNILALVTVPWNLATDQRASVRSFYATNNSGGGEFYWDATVNKNTANGGTIIDPATLGGYDGTVATRDAYLAAQGTGTGSGCWVRVADSVATVTWFGAIGDGVADDSAAITAAHATGRRVYYPNGIYLFTSDNLDFGAGIQRESDSGVTFKNGRYSGVIAFDRSGALIGLHHNHMEVKATGANPTPAIATGNIAAPPESKTAVKGAVDIVAFWYQDFGLDAARDISVGAHKWYTWEWAHTDAPINLSATPKQRGYLPGRHPLLGWYRGDDQNVLDWQCYWLREAGTSAVVVQPRGVNNLLDTTTWGTTSDINNWIYKLLNTVPNARGLGFVTWCANGNFGGNYGDATALANIEAAWDNNVQVLHDSGRAYTVNFNGGNYLLVYLYDGDSLRGDFDNYAGSSNLAAMLARRATYARGLGYAGIAVMARNATTNVSMNRGALLNAGVLYFGAGYATTLTDGTNSAIYADYADAVAAWKHDRLPLVSAPGVHIEALSSGHPSDWGQIGSTPDLFRQMLDKAVRYAAATPNAPKIVTIYNVSEWAEGGASLQPTVGNGWAYLDAVRQVLNASSRDGVPQETHSRNLKPTIAMEVVGPRIGISSDFNQTFAMTPLIAAGAYEGQTITVVNYNLSGNHTVTLADDSVTPGTGVFFRGSTRRALGPWQSVDLRWWPAKGWVEV